MPSRWPGSASPPTRTARCWSSTATCRCCGRKRSRRLLAAHRRRGGAATLLTGDLDDPGAYGRVLRDEAGGVRAIVEAKDATAEEARVREINAGLYAFEVPALLEVLGKLEPKNAQGEFYLTDVVGLLRAAGKTVGAVKAEDPGEALGVNTVAELAETTRLLRLRRAEALMAAGASIEDPATTHIGLDVVVEADAVIRPYTFLEGRTVVRRGASVGPFARLVDAEIGPDAQVLDHCLLRECVVGAAATVGPFAHIRPESRIGARAKVGNFVELKKTHLGDGSKAPHLSYIGDATVGPGREHRGRDHHLQLRRHPQAPHPDRGGGVHRQQQHAGGPGHGGRRGLRGGGQRGDRGRPRRRAGAGPRTPGREAGLGHGAGGFGEAQRRRQEKQAASKGLIEHVRDRRLRGGAGGGAGHHRGPAPPRVPRL